MPQEEDVRQSSGEQRQGGDDPDDEREQHGEVDDDFLLVAGIDHDLDIHEELLKVGAVLGRMISSWDNLGLHDGVQGHGVEGNARSLGDNKDQGALELEVDEEGNVVGALFTLGQLGEDQEAAPALARLCDAHTLQDSSQGLEVALGHTAHAHDAQSADPSIYKEDIGDYDGDGEDPLCDFKGNDGLDLARPLVKGQEVDGSEGIGSVDGAGDEDENPQPGVGKGREARSRLEVGQGLCARLVCVLKAGCGAVRLQCRPISAPRSRSRLSHGLRSSPWFGGVGY